MDELDVYCKEVVVGGRKTLISYIGFQYSYFILFLFARDVSAVPIFTVASESTFSNGGRVLDSFKSSITPKSVECLKCSDQDWLRGVA